MIYKTEIKDVEEQIEDANNYYSDYIDYLEEALNSISDIDIFECGEFYEDAKYHIYDICEEMIHKLESNIKQQQELIEEFKKEQKKDRR